MYKMAAKFAVLAQNLTIVIVAVRFIIFFLAKISVLIGMEEYFLNKNVLNEMSRIILICWLLPTAIYFILIKGVFLYDNRLVIARYTISLTNWNPRIVINYDDIEKVNVNYFDLHYTKRRFSMLVLGGDESYNIELTLKNGKQYYFSIEDQEEFCENLNLLMEKYKNK